MNIVNALIGDWLGLPVPASEGEMLRIVEGRLAYSVIDRLISQGLERGEIECIIIPQRTLQRRRSQQEKLTVEESDHVLRAVRVLSLAQSVYGDKEKVLAWIRNRHVRLNGRSPLSLLKTDTGCRIVEEMLVQIDDGMFV